MTNDSNQQPALDPLAPRLEEALLLSGESQTGFGYLNFRDPAFYRKMRAGRRFRAKMRDKIEQVLERYGV